MKLKVCEYCGTEYDEAMDGCPLCGKGGTGGEQTPRTARRPAQKGGARVAKKSRKNRQDRPERIPQWMWAVSCVVLGIAVLIGLLYFLISMGYLGGKQEEAQLPDSQLSQEVEQPEEEPLPEEEEEPVQVDLSCTGLTLNQTGIVFDEAGSSVFLTAAPTPVDCEDPIVFRSDDESVVTVDQNGMLTAVGYGQTEVFVTCGTVIASCTVVCDFAEEEEPEIPVPEEEPEEEPEEPEQTLPVSLSSEDFTLFRPGEETTLTVKNAPEGAAITYTSSDSSVATVSANGTVKAVGNGMATITVTVGSEKLTCIARCNLGTTAENTDGGTTGSVIGTLSLNYTDVSLFSVGEGFTLNLQDSGGNRATGVSFSTSNSGVCSVDASGKVTAMGSGAATVTASYGGQSYSCIVRCNF